MQSNILNIIPNYLNSINIAYFVLNFNTKYSINELYAFKIGFWTFFESELYYMVLIVQLIYVIMIGLKNFDLIYYDLIIAQYNVIIY